MHAGVCVQCHSMYTACTVFVGSVSMVVNECVFPGTQTKKILRVFIPRG